MRQCRSGASTSIDPNSQTIDMLTFSPCFCWPIPPFRGEGWNHEIIRDGFGSLGELITYKAIFSCFDVDSQLLSQASHKVTGHLFEFNKSFCKDVNVVGTNEQSEMVLSQKQTLPTLPPTFHQHRQGKRQHGIPLHGSVGMALPPSSKLFCCF